MKEVSQQEVYAWLGYWRDKIPAEAVENLQNILGNLEVEEPCLWDSMPETFPGSGIKIGQLSCPCPKCRPRY